MMLVAGKLYSCEEYFLMLYPDKETVGPTRPSASAAAETLRWHAAYWSKRFGKPVYCVEKNIPLLVLNIVLNREEEYIEVLAEDRKGWIINEAWLNLKEIG